MRESKGMLGKLHIISMLVVDLAWWKSESKGISGNVYGICESKRHARH